jgi:hypothetical protein
VRGKVLYSIRLAEAARLDVEKLRRRYEDEMRPIWGILAAKTSPRTSGSR